VRLLIAVMATARMAKSARETGYFRLFRGSLNREACSGNQQTNRCQQEKRFFHFPSLLTLFFYFWRTLKYSPL